MPTASQLTCLSRNVEADTSIIPKTVNSVLIDFSSCMAFQSYSRVETSGEDPEPSGRSKRLCTGLGDEPWPTPQTHWPGNYNLPEEPLDVSRYNSHTLDDRTWSASAIGLDDFSQQHVGDVGGFPGQAWFRSHQDLPWPSSDQDPQPSCFEVVDSTYQLNSRTHDARVQTRPISSAYDPLDPPSSVINPQPEPTSSNLLYGGDLHDEYHQRNAGTISEHGCEDPVADGISDGRSNADIGHEHTSYEVCLGLVGQYFGRHLLCLCHEFQAAVALRMRATRAKKKTI